MEKARKEYEFAVKNPKGYQDHVNKISDKLKLKGASRFDTKSLPKFWGGRLDSNPKVIWFGLNPGLKKDPEKRFNDEELKKNWVTYKKKREENFIESDKSEKKSQYYAVLYKLFCDLFELDSNKTVDWEFFDKNVLTLNLFPYHSNKSEGYTTRFRAGQLGMVMQHLDSILEFAITQKPKICIFSGKVWKTLLIDHKLVKNPKEVRIIGRFSLYFFNYQKLNCVLFNHFLTSSRRDGVNDKLLTKKIPKEIKKQYSV